jgi:hypothetical protein
MALPRIDAPGPRQVAPVDPAHAALPLGDARQEVFDRSLASLLGRTVPVAVLAKMTDGTFLVRVAGNPARMALPDGAQVGTEIPLKVVPASPRPAFQLAGALPSTPLTYSAAGAAAPLPGSADLASLPTADLARVALKPGALPATPTPVPAGDPKLAPQLSPTGRALGDVMAAALKLPMPTEARIATAPIATAPTADTRQIADGLQHAIDKSGMFYESHLAEWAGGERPLAELKGEPQMATGRNALEAVKPGVATDPATAQLISQQLTTQEQGRVAWQGQLWPGQAMQWAIERDPARDAAEGGGRNGDDGAATPWRSQLTLRFAALGELGAQIVMAGDQVHIRLQAGSDASGDVLRAYAGRLQDALAAAGTPAATLAILDPQAAAAAAAAPAETAPVNPGAAAYAQQHD